MRKNNLIVIATGGTGGHVLPALALADFLVDNNYKVKIVTDDRGLVYLNNVDRNLIEVLTINCRSPHCSGFYNKLSAFLGLSIASLCAISLLLWHRPHRVVGFGGYASFPVILASFLLRIPYILQEQNSVMGEVNRIFAKRAAYLALGMECIEKVPSGSKAICTGNPVRSSFIEKRNNIPPYSPPGVNDKINLLVAGGSQGAAVLTEGMIKVIPKLDNDIRTRLCIWHQAPDDNKIRLEKLYESHGINSFTVSSFFSDIDDIMADAHLVISRAGASSLAEITTLGKPSILVPYSKARDDHQLKNAQFLENAGAAILITEDAFLEGGTLLNNLSNLIYNGSMLKVMSDASLGFNHVGAKESILNILGSKPI